MKGINKYINDVTKELSNIILYKNIKGILSKRIKTNTYIIKNNKVNFNYQLFRRMYNNKNKEDITQIIFNAVKNIRDEENEEKIQTKLQ